MMHVKLCTQVVGDVLIPMLVCQATNIAAKALEFIAEHCKIVSACMCTYIYIYIYTYISSVFVNKFLLVC